MPDLLDPDEASAYLEDWKGRIDRMAAGTQAMSDRLAGLRVSARDDDGIVEVTIDSGGTLVDIDFTDRIHRVAPGVVSRAVLRALRAARLTVARRTREIVTETMGPDSVAGRTIADRMEEQLRRDPGEETRRDG
jgi:DNA-binding protein YbaB